uniref:Uncharacterized protein n=1 Tax=Amphimedon queenslandica TaxID=400682 RepID=A0A1X7VW11_AMPQE
LLVSYLVVQHHCQIRVPNSTVDVPGDGNYFMPFHISLLGPFLSITNYVKQLLVICQTLKNCLIVP